MGKNWLVVRALKKEFIKNSMGTRNGRIVFAILRRRDRTDPTHSKASRPDQTVNVKGISLRRAERRKNASGPKPTIEGPGRNGYMNDLVLAAK